MKTTPPDILTIKPVSLIRNLLFIQLLVACTAQADWQQEVHSPNGELSASITLDESGSLSWQLTRNGRSVILPSPMGIRLHRFSFDDGLKPEAAHKPETISDSYELWTGKQSRAAYTANQLRVDLSNPEGARLSVTLRLSDDGLAYRYEFPGESAAVHRVTAELSGVHFHPQTRAWLQPKANAQSGWSNTNPSYEEDYLQDIPVGTPSPTESGWVYPALFRYEDHWILLSETGMDGSYSATNLAQHSENGLYRIRFPQEPEVITDGNLMPEATLPFHTPWRLVLVGDLETVAQSTLGTDLAEPNRLRDTSFVQPGISAWSWGLLKDDFTIYPVQKQFVDYAAEMNWPYVLVDADWDQKIGYEKIAELAAYAAGKDVGLLLWYNSSGAWNETVYSPKSKLLTRQTRRAEFARLQGMGIRGIKVDFFPGDGASVIRYYLDILEDAAEVGLLVNTHGSTLPRGIQRTWPNYLTSEAVKGLEFMTFEQANTDREATHSAMLPFTRNVFDPMDFTPMVLGEIPDRERKTSNGFQLALPVLFISGIQHLVTTPDQMAEMPEFVRDYLRHIPPRWDESRFIEGFPGRYAVFARRAGSRWYVAGINAEPQARKLQLDLGFSGAEKGRLITDGANWRQPAITDFHTDAAEVTLPHGTGFVMILDASEETKHE